MRGVNIKERNKTEFECTRNRRLKIIKNKTESLKETTYFVRRVNKMIITGLRRAKRTGRRGEVTP